MVAHISCLENFIEAEEKWIWGGGGRGEEAERNIYILCAGCPKSDAAVSLSIYLRSEVLTAVNMVWRRVVW
jgi:hypothetical protein